MSRYRQNTDTVYCIHCRALTDPEYSPVHWCIVRNNKGEQVDLTKRKWNHHLRVWVLADDWKDEKQKTIVQQVLEAKRKDDLAVGRQNQYYDTALNAWVDIETGKTEPGPKLDSCEISFPRKAIGTGMHETMCICDDCKPLKIRSHPDSCPCTSCWEWWKSKGKTDYRGTSSYKSTSSSYKPYVSAKPWEGIDREKWPSTYMFCVSLYYINNIWYHGKSIPDDDYKDRILKQIYKPEPKSWRHWTDHDDDRNWGPYGGA